MDLIYNTDVIWLDERALLWKESALQASREWEGVSLSLFQLSTISKANLFSGHMAHTEPFVENTVPTKQRQLAIIAGTKNY